MLGQGKSKMSELSENKYIEGYTEGGYRFKGGDPRDQSNWEKM